MKNKEILIIFILAVLVTGGSFFYGTTKRICPRSSNMLEELMSVCGECTFRGLPFSYYGCWAISGASYSNSTVDLFFLVLDFLLWFLVLFVLWQLTKYIKRKLGNKNKT